MKRVIYISLLLTIATTKLYAFETRQDSLRALLTYLGEDTITISSIMESSYADEPLATIENYLALKLRLQRSPNTQQLEWVLGWDDSIFVSRCTEYITQRIICDTALQLIDQYLVESYVTHHKFEEQIILACAEHSILHFYARRAIIIPELYYFNHQEQSNWEKNLCYYGMIKYILLDSNNSYLFNNDKLGRQLKRLTMPNDKYPYFTLYRKTINEYSDYELARLTPKQKKKLIKILRMGVMYKDDKAKLLYSFILITGLFCEQNEVKGYKMLFDVIE